MLSVLCDMYPISNEQYQMNKRKEWTLLHWFGVCAVLWQACSIGFGSAPIHICSIQVQIEIQIFAQQYSKWVCDPYLEYTAALSLLFVLKPTFIKHLCWTPCSSGFIKHLLNINPEQYWRRVPLTNSYSRPTSLSDKIEFQKIQIQIQVQHKIQRDIVENASNAIILSWSSCWLISGLPGWLSASEISSIRSN